RELYGPVDTASTCSTNSDARPISRHWMLVQLSAEIQVFGLAPLELAARGLWQASYAYSCHVMRREAKSFRDTRRHLGSNLGRFAGRAFDRDDQPLLPLDGSAKCD